MFYITYFSAIVFKSVWTYFLNENRIEILHRTLMNWYVVFSTL